MRPYWLIATVVTASACGGEDVGGECAIREAEARNPNQESFTPSALRWSCADTPSINGLDRGQEYCEYFALIRLPSDTNTRTLSRLETGPEPPEDDSCEIPTQELFYDQTKLALTSEEITTLESALGEVVGACVFSSWNEDVDLEITRCDPPANCPQIVGLTVSREMLQMKRWVNSNEAAQFLLEDCAGATQTDPQDPIDKDECGDPLTFGPPNNDIGNGFQRGCRLNAEVNGTIRRKSDTVLCTAAMRLGECGCDSTDSERTLADLLSPFERRGFPLGTWTSAQALPEGCRYVELGDNSQTIVECDLTASDLLAAGEDVVDYCRDRYGPDVVVYAPISEEIQCVASNSESPFAPECPEMPWLPGSGD